MAGLGYTPYLADPDLWLKAEVRLGNNVSCYSYIICYVDDILVIHHDASSILDQIDEFMKLKEGLVGDPNV